MLKLIILIGRGYDKYMTRLARQHALQVLACQNDATLRDIGISREMLNSGVSSWPWQSAEHGSELRTEQRSKQSDATAIESPASRSRATYHKVMSKARAIRELQSYSTRELRDLGITRDSIVEAVNYGRPGIEHTFATTQKPVTATPPVATAKVATAKPQLLQNKDADKILASDFDSEQSTADDRQAA